MFSKFKNFLYDKKKVTKKIIKRALLDLKTGEEFFAAYNYP